MNINSNYTKYFKPIGDYFLGICLAILLVIPFCLIWIALYISGEKTPIFKQDRPGKGENVFYILKFKTMTDALDDNKILLPDAKRITAFGYFLRKTSLDEIPQIINILNGDMSFVGPRPLRTRYLPYYSKEESIRHHILPGITGLAQISGRNALTWDDKLNYDIIYAHKMSLRLDMEILFKTIFEVFKTNKIDIDDSSFDDYRKDKLKDNSLTQQVGNSK